jgi:hypothetical protein
LKGVTKHDSIPQFNSYNIHGKNNYLKNNAAILMKDSRKKKPTNVVDTSMPREKVGACVKSLARKHDSAINKKKKKGACVDLGATALVEYAC